MTTFYPTPSDDTLKRTYSSPYNTQLCVERTIVNGKNVDTPIMGQKWVVFDKNEQKIVMGKYKREVWEKEKQWHCCQEQKKLLNTVVWGQLDDDT